MAIACRDPVTGVLLAIFSGVIGAHRFYLKDMTGIVYVLFCWTLIPAIVAIVEAFFMPRRIRVYNARAVDAIAARMNAETAPPDES